MGTSVVGGVHAMRRGEARRGVTERVILRNERDRILEGWVLNVSRGGVRAILEERVELGQKFDVVVGTDPAFKRRGRAVWIQEEPDGVIVGIEFANSSSAPVESAPPSPHREMPARGDGEEEA